jgi:hypothetical protein
MERAAQAVRFLRDVLLLIVRALLVSLLVAATPAFAQPTAVPVSSPPPDAVAAPLRALLSSAAQKVTIGGTTLEFWWVSALPVTGGGLVSWSSVAEGALIGVVRVTGPFKEIRGKTVNPGVYTLRFGLQPQNGDHLGVSPFREYLLLSPTAADSDPKPLGFDGTVAISKQTIGTSHPAALSLDPPTSTAAPLTAHRNELDHQGITFEVKTVPAGTLKFGLILLGLIEH